jgi:hypothetical protein
MNYALRDVAEGVAIKCEMPLQTLLSGTRRVNVAHPRQIVMFLAREFTGASYPKIGRYLGMDHSTVHYGVKRVRALIAEDPDYADEVSICRALIVDRGPWRARQKAAIDRQRVAEAAEDAAEAASDNFMLGLA